MLKNSSDSYGLVAKALHWLMALLILTLIAVGIYMADLPDGDPSRPGIYNLHKSFGVVALLLIAVRLAWLRISPAPALPAVFSGKERALVKALQGLLYLFMLLVPISGYVMSTAAGHPVNPFGLGELPALLGESKALGGFAHEAHEIMGYTILLVIALHVAGALKHRLKDKGGESDILKRML